MERLKGLFYLICAFTLAGTSVISAHFVSGKLGIFTITLISMFFSIFILLPLCRLNIKKAIQLINLQTWLMLFGQALCGIFMFRMFLLLGLLHTSSCEAGIMTGATPVVTTLFAWFLLKESITKKSLLGILTTISGIFLIQGILLPGSRFALEHFVGNMLVLCAAVCESMFNIFSRINILKIKNSNTVPLNPMVQTTVVSGIALILCIIPSLFEHPVMSLMSIGVTEWAALVWYGFFVTALAFIFWYAGIKRCPAHIAAAFSGMMPLTSLILSVVLLGELARWQQWAGGLMVILGMFMIGSSQSNKKSELTSPLIENT